MELVEGLGVSLPTHEVLGAVRDSKTASSLTRKLMSLLFTNQEMATSSVKGKTKEPLNKQKMEAIIGKYSVYEWIDLHCSLFSPGIAISKNPTATSEYLIRQANDKLHAERKKYNMQS